MRKLRMIAIAHSTGAKRSDMDRPQNVRAVPVPGLSVAMARAMTGRVTGGRVTSVMAARLPGGRGTAQAEGEQATTEHGHRKQRDATQHERVTPSPPRSPGHRTEEADRFGRLVGIDRFATIGRLWRHDRLICGERGDRFR